MLYILGGSPRVGKTIIAQEFMERARIPFLSLDLLKMSLVKGIPEAGVDAHEPSAVVAEQMWPAVKGLCTTILENQRDHLIEGDSILPSHVNGLAAAFPGKVRACFVGFENVDPDEKLSLIRSHPGPEDWLSDLRDDEVRELIDEMVEYSKQLRVEAQQYGIPYIESSTDFGAFKERVIRCLESGQR